MKKRALSLRLFLGFILSISTLMAQEDTTKMVITPIMTKLPGCANLDGPQLKTCQQTSLVNYLNEHINYPVSAVSEGIEGRVNQPD